MRFTTLTLAVGLIFGGALAALAEETMRVITVTGTADVTDAPDMATVQIGVTHEDPQAALAMERAAAGAAGVLERLTASGIAERDVQTGTLSLNPVWSDMRASDTPPQITGFVARISMTVRVRDLETLGGVLDAVVTDGANQLGGIQFGFQDPDPMMDEARRQAVANGRARAELLAEAAGVTLGPLQSLSEHGGNGRPIMMEMRAASDAGIPIVAGEISLNASVSMVYRIAE